MHVSSYFRELAAMAQAGMSNAQILKASTQTAGEIISDQTGKIAEGFQADLVLLNQDPLQDWHNLLHKDLVINNGNVFHAGEIIHNQPLDLVLKQLTAYNHKDLNTFLQPYADSIQVFNFPDEMVLDGKDFLRQNMQSFFSRVPDLHCEILNRMILGNTIIDYERVSGLPIVQFIDAIAVYEIQGNKIRKMYYIRK